MKGEVFILGVGTNTPVCIDLVRSCGYKIGGLYYHNSERNGEVYRGEEILDSMQTLLERESLEGMNFVLSMGNIALRKSIYEQVKSLGGSFPQMIHPSAVISCFAQIGDGVHIGALTHIQADTEIGANTSILSGVNISHTNIVGEHCFIAESVTLGAYTTVEDEVFIGQAASTISLKVETIGRGAFIGARALVTKSVAPNVCVAGFPAREIEKKI